MPSALPGQAGQCVRGPGPGSEEETAGHSAQASHSSPHGERGWDGTRPAELRASPPDYSVVSRLTSKEQCSL